MTKLIDIHPFLSKCLLICLFFMIVSACNNVEKAELVINNAYIYSVDNKTSVYEAVAIKGDKIVAVGSNEQIAPYIDESTTEVLDAGGAFVLPGLIEGHGHFSGMGKSLMNLNFLKSKSWQEIVDMVAEKVQLTPKGHWIIGRGWHQEKWDDQPHDHVHGYPRHFDLSAISPDHPVLLVHASGHGSFANALAMDLAGITPESRSPVGGEIVRDITGRPIGMFEERAQQIIFQAYQDYLARLSEQDQINEWYTAIDLAQEECLKWGITSFQDAGSSYQEITSYKKLAEEGKLKLRLWTMARHNSQTLKGKVAQYRMIDAGNGHFTCRAIKTEVDGALGPYGAWLIDSYDDKQHFIGQNTTMIEEVDKIADIALEANMQLCVHAIGDKANQIVLDLIEKKLSTNTKKDLRWRIEHAQHLHPSDIPRFAQLGVIASMQGIHCTSDAPFVEKRLGYERARVGAYAWRGLLDAGAIVTNGSDVPVEDINPIESFYASVTRKRVDNGMAFFPENSMTRAEAIYSYTMANAIAAFEEKSKGSIEPGKYADITIIDKNWITCTDEDILDTQVLFTIVAGKVLYRKE